MPSACWRSREAALEPGGLDQRSRTRISNDHRPSGEDWIVPDFAGTFHALWHEFPGWYLVRNVIRFSVPRDLYGRRAFK